jgi:hypothetical protein
MKSINRILPLLLFFSILATGLHAEKYRYGKSTEANTNIKSTAAGCVPGANFKWLEINNVRCRINTGGDMWWDFETAQYEIPKGSRKMSMFSGSLWLGGLDVNNQLKLAALRYRQVGNDYWPGPLTIDGTAAIDDLTCAQYDKLFDMTRADVDEFLAYWDDPSSYAGYVIPSNILKWPAHGDVSKGQSYYLAPFYDRNGDGQYDPQNDGDYPYYDVSNELCHTKIPTAEGNGILVDQVIKGDYTLWWVFNDKGNIHTETSGSPIGVEIRGQAFGFSTNDEVNNMTFYSYEIINRSTYRLRETYFCQWVDTDLGYAWDDYVGCDVKRGLGYCYNGTPIDGQGQAWAYGSQPPAIGVDYFQGPYMDPDGIDNPKYNATTGENCDVSINGVNFANEIVDDERFGMRRFVYHNNGGAAYMNDPSVAIDYYNLMKGIWKDGTRMIWGGNAHSQGGGLGPECDFMFPGNSDPCYWGTGGLPPNGMPYWTEETAGNDPDDRRFMQSAGPFTLEPGAVNYITVGIPWARASSGGPFASVEALRVIDDKCQMLFDNCFKVISGPNAPDLTIRELDRQLIIYMSNRKTNDAGNNYQEKYQEYDPRIVSPDSLSASERYDSTYNFEGYQIFQLKNATVTSADIYDAAKTRLVFQCDVKNGITRLTNYKYDAALNGNIPVVEVDGADEGIVHSFSLTEDAFTGEKLVNHQQYYYLAIAYAYNYYEPYDPNDPEQYSGQKLPYLPGRKNIKTYTGIPHATVGLTEARSSYGEGVALTRIAGQGNGSNILEMSKETVDEILAKNPVDSVNILGTDTYPIAYNIKYEKGKGPLDVKVIDPLNVKSADYTIKFDSMFMSTVPIGDMDTLVTDCRWTLIDNTSGTEYRSDTLISFKNEQIFLDLGLSISIMQPFNPGPYRLVKSANQNGTITYSWGPAADNNGYLSSEIVFADSSNYWLTGIPDIDGYGSFNWIRSGSVVDPNDARNNDWNVTTGTKKAYDAYSVYEQLIPASYMGSTGGTWSPYTLVAGNKQDSAGPAYGEIANLSKTYSLMSDLASVNVVFTSDKSKWTRSPILEMCPIQSLSEGNAKQFELRKHRSVNQDGDTAVESSDPAMNSDYISAYGMGWFPGYAINLETGERLNIVFGEDSHLTEDNGNDMLFNPTSNIEDNNGNTIFGGKHYIYVMAHTERKYQNTLNTNYDCPAYDAGKNFVKAFTVAGSIAIRIKAIQLSNAMWVTIPLASRTGTWLGCDATVKLRVGKPYIPYFSLAPTEEYALAHNDNNFYPMFSFSTSTAATDNNNQEKAVSDLDKINVVPNPYYAYSPYETNQLDNRIKIVNLPAKAIVTIYSTSGTLIRQFPAKDGATTYIDWDLKNSAGIPISGGLYLIHVRVPGVGEKVVKWFGALRPVDLNAF